jgi:hypothetical protein
LTSKGHETDYTAYSVIHDTYRADWLTKSMELATRLGEPKTAGYGLVAFGFFGTPTAMLTAKLAAVSLLSSSLITTGVKYITNRDRPEGMSPRSNSSFPSGHAAGAAAVAVLVSKRHGRLGIIAWLLAFWVMLSRISGPALPPTCSRAPCSARSRPGSSCAASAGSRSSTSRTSLECRPWTCW